MKVKTWGLFGLLFLSIAVILAVVFLVNNDPSSAPIDQSSADITDTRNNSIDAQDSIVADGGNVTIPPNSETELFNLLTLYQEGSIDVFRVIAGISALNTTSDLRLIEEIDGMVGNRMLMDTLLPILVLHQGNTIGFEGVFEQVKDLEGRIQRMMFPLVIKGWAETDPKGALDAAATLVKNGFPSDYTTEILTVWSEVDYDGYVESIHSLPITLRKVAQAVRFATLAKESPGEASRHIGAFLGSIYQLGLAKTLAQTWILKDSAAALDWIKNSENITAYVRQEAAFEALRTLALTNPREALEHALEIGMHPDISSATSTVFEVVAMSDIEYAKEMLPKLTHLSTQIALARAMVKHEDWDGILNLMNSVRHERRKDYSEYVFQYWAMNNPTTLLDRIVHLESDLASRAALEVLIQNRAYYFLSPVKTAQLEEVLTSEHKQTWAQTKDHMSSRTITILDKGFGFSRTYSLDEVKSALYRDLEKRADILPFRVRE